MQVNVLEPGFVVKATPFMNFSLDQSYGVCSFQQGHQPRNFSRYLYDFAAASIRDIVKGASCST